MKKFLKSVLLALICAVTVCAVVLPLSACKDKKLNLLEENIIDDKYDNYYEIFVASFKDTNGDGCGDLNGVAEKMDYIRDMGYTGIWLMPINPCSSYHGYDVTDYYGINPKYGTLDDYKNLLEVAHEKGVKVIIDLVVNHTSWNHPWFKAALDFKKGISGPEQIKYKDFYNFAPSNVPPNQLNGYNEKDGFYYESNFDKGMPDLNLEHQSVRNELENVIKFWLEMGTDGFRLDGCKYYCNEQDKSVEFCRWIQDTSEKYNENVYIVGEEWDNLASIETFYESGVDSFFNFDVHGKIQASVNTCSSDQLWVAMYRSEDAAGDAIPAPFLSNHDNGVGRIAGRMARKEDRIKFAYGLVSMFTGNTFTYYGDEIGMIAKKTDSDPDLRIGILWDDVANLTTPPPGASKNPEYLFDSVEKQLKDSGSILSYYKLCNNTRNAFPAIMRGKSTRIELDEPGVLVMRKEYGDQSVTVVINMNEDGVTVNGIEGSLAQSLTVDGEVKRNGSSLKMPALSIAILT